MCASVGGECDLLKWFMSSTCIIPLILRSILTNDSAAPMDK